MYAICTGNALYKYKTRCGFDSKKIIFDSSFRYIKRNLLLVAVYFKNI